MKKIIIAIAIFGIFLSACNKDDDNNPEPFSQLSVEENKEVIEDAGIEMINTIDDIKDLDAIEVAVNLSDILDTADPINSRPTKKSKLAYTVDAIAGLAVDDMNLNSFIKDLKYGGEPEEEPESIQDLWEDIVGTYAWNSNTLEWDYTVNTTEIVLLFPAMDNSTSNDGEVRIYGYSGVFIDNPLDEDYEGDLPAAIAFDISVNNIVIITYTFSATYNSDGIPTMVATDLSIPPFKWEADLTNNDTEISTNFKFTHNDEIVMEVGGGAKGLFTQANIDANTVIHTNTYTYTDYVWNPNTQEYEEVEVTYTDEWEEVEFEEIVNSTNAHFQLFNILLKGEVNVKILVNEIQIIEDSETEYWTNNDYNSAVEDMVKIINENINLRVLNTDTDEKIAEIEAYVVSEIYDGEEEMWIDFRFIFSDDSSIDAETYFDEGFENFINEINRLIDDVNTEYDAEIDPIDY